MMVALGVLPEVAERCLNHTEEKKVKRIYQRHSYENEMGQAWALLGDRLALLTSGFGAFVAARQSWLQWNPPEFSTCGRDFYGIVENYSFSRALPMLFRGSGDCSAVDWTFLGGSIANWSFLWFSAFAIVLAVLLVRPSR